VASSVDLDPRSYPGTYKLIGGTPALDLANLVSFRGTPREHDWLEPSGNAERWASAAGLPLPERTDIRRLRRFREVVARTFLAVVDGESPDPDDLADIGAAAAAAFANRQLVYPSSSERDGQGVPGAGPVAARWYDTWPSLLGVLAIDATDLLTSETAIDRIRACTECRWLFLDTTRNRSRRWCDPGDCGNRVRQRRHYRHRSRGDARQRPT